MHGCGLHLDSKGSWGGCRWSSWFPKSTRQKNVLHVHPAEDVTVRRHDAPRLAAARLWRGPRWRGLKLQPTGAWRQAPTERFQDELQIKCPKTPTRLCDRGTLQKGQDRTHLRTYVHACIHTWVQCHMSNTMYVSRTCLLEGAAARSIDAGQPEDPAHLSEYVCMRYAAYSVRHMAQNMVHGIRPA